MSALAPVSVPTILALWMGCSEGVLVIPEQPLPDPEPLALTVDSPAAAATFVGDRAEVRGRVNDPGAIVWIEGYRANVGPDGGFVVEVPVDGDFRIVDIEAARPSTSEHLRERRVVYGGVDPMASWNGGIGLRATPVLLDHLAEIVQEQIAALDVPGQLEATAQELVLGDLVIAPGNVVAEPTPVTLTSDVDGLLLTVSFGRFEASYTASSPTLDPTEVVLGIDDSTLTVRIALGLEPDGSLALTVVDTDIALGAPVFEVAGIDPEALEQLAAGLTGGLGDLVEGALDAVISLVGTMSLPVGDLSLDGLGLPLSLGLASLGTDPDGIGGLLSVDLGVPAPGTPQIPDRIAAGPQADLALTVHEGLFGALLDTMIEDAGLLDLLNLELELPAFLGEVVALPIGALPGGDQLPEDRTGMCLSLEVGPERVARMRTGLAPIAVVSMPDLHVTVGVSTPSAHCASWLQASLAVAASLDVEGTLMAVQLDVVDGAVLSYAAETEYLEDEVVGGLGALVDVASSLLGGAGLSIDLADLLGGLDTSTLPVGELSPRLIDSVPARGPDGAVLPGTMVISLSLWD